MSALTDFFTSLSNKIRSKLNTSITYTPDEAVNAIDDVYNEGVNDTKKGNANIGDVKNGVTFTSTNGVNLTGTFTSQEKTITGSRSAQTVTPDSGKYLSKVTVNALTPTGTFNASTTRSTAIDMGATNNYRYVNTNSVSNTNSGTYTPTSNSSAHDMGATNTYRYVNTNTVYNSGYSDGSSAGYNSGYSDGYAAAGHAINFVYSSSYDMPGASNTVAFYPTGLRASSNYCVMFFGFQLSGTYTGVGSGANISPGQQGFSQKEARSDNTSGYGGMVVWAQTMFMASSSQASIIVNFVNNMRLHCEIRVMGLTS